MDPRDRLPEIGSWMLETWHRTSLALTGGRWPRTLMGMPTLELHAIGRKTGERRTTLLSAPICEEDRIVLVASKGGAKDHPIWYKNLVANPEVEITINDTTRKMRARTATAEERADLWLQIVAKYKGYAAYQRNTDREIPVVICEPIPS